MKKFLAKGGEIKKEEPRITKQMLDSWKF